jgi:hypothetical protein
MTKCGFSYLSSQQLRRQTVTMVIQSQSGKKTVKPHLNQYACDTSYMGGIGRRITI